MSVIVNHDARTLFERAWAHGVAAGVLTDEHRAAAVKDGTRALLKLADILGTRALRVDLERAMRSMLGLVNLHLQQVSGGNPAQAARSLAENGLLFHTRGASQAIKRLLAIEEGRDPDAMTQAALAAYEAQVLTFPYAHFDARLEAAESRAPVRAAARALADLLEIDDPEEFLHMHDPEAVLMTALLVLAWGKRAAWPRSTRELEQLFEAIRKSPRKLEKLPAAVPPEHADAAERVRAERLKKLLASITDTSTPLHLLVDGGADRNPLLGLIAFPDDALADLDDLSASTTSHWEALTGGTSDEARLLAVMLRAVPGFDAPVPMTLAAAVGLLRTRFASRPDDDQLRAWLEANAPHQHHMDLEALWNDFWEAREYELAEDAGKERLEAFARQWLPVRVARAKTSAAAAKKPVAAKKPGAAKEPTGKKPANVKKPANAKKAVRPANAG